MIEFITLTILTLLVITIMRPGKTPPLDNPLDIERPGQYHMMLAPQLNLAQPFIEAVVGQIVTPGETAQDSATQFFEVRDKQVTAHGYACYLLAITQRNGMLYFQAVSPQSDDSNNNLRTISEFANAKLARFPATGIPDTTLDERILAAAQEAAQLRGINIRQL